MKGSPNIARIGALIGDPARAAMLEALMDGRALTATELARVAGISPQTASTHLAQLVSGEMLIERRQGRHKYFSLAGEAVANLIENMMQLLPPGRTVRTGPRDGELRTARVCYNHLAGDRGVQLFDNLVSRGAIARDRQGNLSLTAVGESRVADFGIDVPALQRGRSVLCRECLDWSERRSHLAGSLGRAMLARFEALGWLARVPQSRILRFTRKGDRAFNAEFPIE